MNALLSKLKKGRDGGTKSVSVPKSTVLLPLYIYPLNSDSWQPLYAAIKQNPQLNFVVIINPHNGPGADSLPDENYSQEIPKLNAHPNVQTVGYVATNYCKRDLASVCEDIAKYAGWSEATVTTTSAVHDKIKIKTKTDNDADRSSESSPPRQNANLGVKGIFFDETPNLYSANVAVYLNSITRYVKGMQGILGSRLVLHNPGTVPDPQLSNPGPDVTAILEGSFTLYSDPGTQSRISNLLNLHRDRVSYIVHSVPVDRIAGLVQDLRWKAKYILVTDGEADNVYTRFGRGWTAFIDAMALE